MRSQCSRLITLALGAVLGVALMLAAPVAAQTTREEWEAMHGGDAEQQAACAAAVAQQQPQNGGAQTVSGTGQVQSAPFQLRGGAYRVDWSMAQPTTAF